MLAKVHKCMLAMYRRTIFVGDPMTIGEISKSAKIPYSSVRRYLQRGINSAYIQTEFREYKKTGKHVFWLTEEGLEWVEGYKSLWPMEFQDFKGMSL